MSHLTKGRFPKPLCEVAEGGEWGFYYFFEYDCLYFGKKNYFPTGLSNEKKYSDDEWMHI